MKRELIEERAGDIFTEYTLGPDFIDFCRGPHVPSSEKLKAFKLLSIAGAYWKGNEKNPQLQRIYGTAFFTKKELEDYLNRLEEAKKRDHRASAKSLNSSRSMNSSGQVSRSGFRRARPSAASWKTTFWRRNGDPATSTSTRPIWPK